MLGCDLIVTAGNEALSKIHAGRTTAVVNTNESPTAEFVRNPNWQYGAPAQIQQVRDAVGNDDDVRVHRRQGLATRLLGDAIYTNPFMLGFAWQRGWVPLALRVADARDRAQRRGDRRQQARLRLGPRRRARPRGGQAHRLPGCAGGRTQARRRPLEEIVARRVEFLTGYQDAGYAKRYSELVERVRKVESDRLQSTKLTEAVARYYFKLLAYKDEYEVARLQSDPAFRAQDRGAVRGRAGKDYELNFYLAPPLLAKIDPDTGRPRKMRFGPWMMSAFTLLAKLKFLRGTAFDIFGRPRTPHRACADRRVRAAVDELLSRLAADNHAVAVQLASIPEEIRGYGHVKERHLEQARAKWADLLATYRGQQKAQVIQMPARAA